jgi:putative Holliday junction resolvase
MAALITTDIEAFAAAIGANGRLLGIDLGTKTAGLATCDPGRMVATALKTLKRDKFSKLRGELEAVLAEQAIVGIVIGLPLNMDGSAGPRVQATRAFSRNVADTVELPQLQWDERLSTVQAERMLIDADATRKRRAEVIDQVAATLILQSALDRLARL